MIAVLARSDLQAARRKKEGSAAISKRLKNEVKQLAPTRVAGTTFEVHKVVPVAVPDVEGALHHRPRHALGLLPEEPLRVPEDERPPHGGSRER